MELFSILANDILPLLFFLGAGYALDAKFKPDLNTYNKLVIYIVLPSFIFYGLVQYTPSASSLYLAAAAVLLLVLLSGFSGMAARLFGVPAGERAVFRAASAYSNAGNLGLALIVFIYSHEPFLVGEDAPYLDEARGTVMLLLLLMNIAVNLFGACRLRRESVSVPSFLKYLVRMPALYAALAALLCRAAGFPVEHTFVWPVLHHFAAAFLVLVTVIVGAQLHRAGFRRPSRAALLAALCRLFLSPALAALIIAAAGCFTPIEAQVFFIAASIPASFTLVLYAAEYGNHPELAAEIVATTTAASLVTLPLMITLAQTLYNA